MIEDRRPVIYQANPLIEGRKPFGTIEMRLFLLALQHVNPHLSKDDKFFDQRFEELHLTPTQTKEIFGHGEYLNRLQSVCDGMAQKVVTVDYEVKADSWNRLDLTFSANGADSTFIGDGSNYTDLYFY